MIIIANKKAGVGCTTLAFSLSNLFKLNLYVHPDSFLLNNKYFLNSKDGGKDHSYIKKINTIKEKGVFDIGTRIENKSSHQFIKNAKVAVIPVELGLESIEKAIETIKYIRGVNYDIPIVVVLNRLIVKNLNDRDDIYKNALKDKFIKADLEFYENTIGYTDEKSPRLILTYLRNSYGLFTNMDKRYYFLDNFKSEKVIQRKDRKTGEITYKEKTSERENYLKCDNFDFRFFKYLTSIELKKGDYQNDEIYRQDKDMVLFRTDFNNRYIEDYDLLDCPYDSEFLRLEKHLIKDMSFVAYAVQCHLGMFY